MNDAIVESARLWIGTPYRHQASTKGIGCDCLGLVRGVWRDVIGPEPEPVPRYTLDWTSKGSNNRFGADPLWDMCFRQFVPAKKALVSGNVVLFQIRSGTPAKHLGIISRAGHQPRFIHSYSRYGVIEHALTHAWERRILAQFSYPEPTVSNMEAT